MKRKRRTSEEVTNDMFNERKKSGDLVTIAFDDEELDYWCECNGRCGCGKPEKYFFSREAVIYRSIGKPNLCFYYEWYCDEHANMNSELHRLDYQYLKYFVKHDMTLNEQEYAAIKRKMKVKKVLAS